MFDWLTYWDMLVLGAINVVLGLVALMEIEALLRRISGANGLLFTVAAFGGLFAALVGGFISMPFNGIAHGGAVMGYGVLSIVGWVCVIGLVERLR